MAGETRLLRRRRRAEEDLRAAHRIVHDLTRIDADAPAWLRCPGGGWSRAETLLHLAKTGGRVVEELRLVAAQGALTRPIMRTTSQGMALKFMFTTWRVPGRLELIRGTEPDGVVASPAEVRELHVVWTASYVALLRENTPEFLTGIRWAHPRFGDLDALEWARFLRIYFRHHELRIGVR